MTDETVATDQAPVQSVEDRIASKFGLPGKSSPATAQSAQAETPDTVESDLAEINWDGETYRVPSKLKDAFMRNDDYTRKTQEISEQRRTLEHLRELSQQAQLDKAFFGSVENEQQELAMIDAYLQQASRIDWSNMTTDQILRNKVEVDNVKERRLALKESVDSKRAKFNDEFTAKVNELRGKSREVASKSIPGFGEETEKAVRDYAMREGLTAKEIDNVLLDPRSVKVLYKAMQFEKVQAGTQKAVDSATKADRVLKPGAASERMPNEKAAELNYRKAMNQAKNSSQKARVIEDRLAGKFG